jgi:hypothetical protein
VEFSQRRRQVGASLNTTHHSAAGASPSLRDLRRPRHAGLFEAVQRLDAQLDASSRAELVGWVKDQYVVEYGDIPMGFAARCYLGPPFVDHRLDLLHDIVDHFSAVEVMPEPFEGARMLVRSDEYAFVEVYGSGRLVPVRHDGSVVVPESSGT